MTIGIRLSCFVIYNPTQVILNLFQDLTASLYYDKSFTADRC